ncbi:MAG: hypothetical protein KIH69_016120 [Anaerolineae bacterium]|nr:hypothetical protein [Anaerolineae bacterium]
MKNSQKSRSLVYGVCAGLASLVVLAIPALSDVTSSLTGGGIGSSTTSEKCVFIESKFGDNFVDGQSCSNIFATNADGSKGQQLTFKALSELPAGTQVIICSDQVVGGGYVATTPLKDSPPYVMVSGLPQCVKK